MKEIVILSDINTHTISFPIEYDFYMTLSSNMLKIVSLDCQSSLSFLHDVYEQLCKVGEIVNIKYFVDNSCLLDLDINMKCTIDFLNPDARAYYHPLCNGGQLFTVLEIGYKKYE